MTTLTVVLIAILAFEAGTVFGWVLFDKTVYQPRMRTAIKAAKETLEILTSAMEALRGADEGEIAGGTQKEADGSIISPIQPRQ